VAALPSSDFSAGNARVRFELTTFNVRSPQVVHVFSVPLLLRFSGKDVCRFDSCYADQASKSAQQRAETKKSTRHTMENRLQPSTVANRMGTAMASETRWEVSTQVLSSLRMLQRLKTGKAAHRTAGQGCEFKR
jgi:hypothetical protein